MVTAYVLIETEVGKAGQVAGAATEINGVQHAYPLTGPYDVIVRAEARNIDALGQLVVSRIQAINGVTRTLTCPMVHASVAGPRCRRHALTMPSRSSVCAQLVWPERSRPHVEGGEQARPATMPTVA